MKTIKKYPKKYINKLSVKDKKKQLKALNKSTKSYKKGKYYERPKMKSFKNKKSSWTQKFHKLYPEVKTLKQIEKVTGIPKKALMAVKKKEWEHIILLVQDQIKQLNHGEKHGCMLIYLDHQLERLIIILLKNTKLNLNISQIIIHIK